MSHANQFMILHHLIICWSKDPSGGRTLDLDPLLMPMDLEGISSLMKMRCDLGVEIKGNLYSRLDRL